MVEFKEDGCVREFFVLDFTKQLTYEFVCPLTYDMIVSFVWYPSEGKFSGVSLLPFLFTYLHLLFFTTLRDPE